MLEREHQGHTQHDVYTHSDHADAHRGFCILARIEAGRQHLHQNKPEQAGGKGDECLGTHAHILFAERAVMEKGDQQRAGEQHQRHGGGYANQEHPAQRPVEQTRELMLVATRVLARQTGQNHRRQRDPEHAERELHESVGIIKPGHTTSHQERSQYGVDERVDLRHRHAEDRWQHELEHARHAIVPAFEPGPRQQS